jgi:hypothetical protein
LIKNLEKSNEAIYTVKSQRIDLWFSFALLQIPKVRTNLYKSELSSLVRGVTGQPAQGR